MKIFFKIKRNIKRLWRRHKNKNHRYLTEVYGDNLPFPYCEKGYPAFDDRDTFNLCDTFVEWMYERLRFFQDYASKVVDFDAKEFEIDGKTLTQTQCINKMVICCQEIMQPPDFAYYYSDVVEQFKAEDEFVTDRINELFKVFAACYGHMWW